MQELGSFNSIIWLIENLPFNPKPLKLTDQNVGGIFYPGDVHIKNSCAVSGTVWIKGKLIINGQLLLQKNAFVKGCVKAEQIELQKNSSISGFVETAQIELQKNSRIFGFVEADVIIHEKKRGTEPFKSVLFNYSGYANGKFIFWKNNEQNYL
ncbi:hypothetical protein BHC46_12380 [Snodgrassella alvi]|uniref:Polymer-forming cytoskeletal protein n=1 Tax=Snodgrassella alvi TaxID=1196083 RepID=A0A2N9XBA2_9NEIS|nr:polymer-forming cytoskeletal protein [Snodgrassella alvi]PIT43793.1 hypothetical protein BHC46_12380 [Snodgrassella alvi]